MNPAKGLEASKEKALEYYRKAAAGKHKDAVYRMSFILLASDKEDERDQARQALETAAKDDPAVAARILGEAYLRGLLTPAPDPDKAVFWWKRAADAGDVLSVLLRRPVLRRPIRVSRTEGRQGVARQLRQSRRPRQCRCDGRTRLAPAQRRRENPR